jgi:hypothetical protein
MNFEKEYGKNTNAIPNVIRLNKNQMTRCPIISITPISALNLIVISFLKTSSLIA